MARYRTGKVVYEDGYEHYDKSRTIQVIFLVNEAEKNFLDDLTAALQVQNKSEFIRKQVFRAYQSLTDEQKEKMQEVSAWRHENDKS